MRFGGREGMREGREEEMEECLCFRKGLWGVRVIGLCGGIVYVCCGVGKSLLWWEWFRCVGERRGVVVLCMNFVGIG